MVAGHARMVGVTIGVCQVTQTVGLGLGEGYAAAATDLEVT